MKYILVLLFGAIIFFNCNKNDDKTDTLSAEDLTASRDMEVELNSMKQAITNLLAATITADRQYWDGQYHYHDSLFWVHHDLYHHEHYFHDDHHHDWLPYDPNINHQHHYHHPYPNHHSDSLTTSPNNHHHDNHDHHFPGHDLIHHHSLDSLHQIHSLHHP